jgi:general stress protein YciG
VGRLPAPKKPGTAARRSKTTYGPDFFARIGKKGGEAMKQGHGAAYYAEIGRKGGESTRRTRGFDFYSRIGKVGGQAGKRGGKGQPSA